MSKTPWIVAGPAPAWGTCTRCGDSLTLGPQVLVSVYLAASKAFIKAHKNCKAKAKP